MALITRICTVYRQWPEVETWLGDDALFGPDIAWIFVNDAPDAPPSAALQQRLTQRGAQVVTMPRNSGRSLARNAGTAAATTEWVEHIDGDDRPLPFPLAELPVGSAALVFFPVRHRGDASDRLPETEDSFEYHAPDRFLNLLFAPLQPMDWRPCSTLWRRSALQDLGGYDPRFEPSEDIHLAWRALQASLPAGHGRTAKQCYSCENKSTEAGSVGLALRLRLLRAIADGGLAPDLQRVWQEDFNSTVQLVYWKMATLIAVHDRNPRLYFFRESIKHLLRALRWPSFGRP